MKIKTFFTSSIHETVYPIEKTLSCIQFGFHTQPTVGYLHMHMLIGPLTEEGETYQHRWISLDKVIDYLKI